MLSEKLRCGSWFDLHSHSWIIPDPVCCVFHQLYLNGQLAKSLESKTRPPMLPFIFRVYCWSADPSSHNLWSGNTATLSHFNNQWAVGRLFRAPNKTQVRAFNDANCFVTESSSRFQHGYPLAKYLDGGCDPTLVISSSTTWTDVYRDYLRFCLHCFNHTHEVGLLFLLFSHWRDEVAESYSDSCKWSPCWASQILLNLWHE